MQFMIGDAIVWWRASAIWPHKAIYALGSLLIAVTLGMYMHMYASRSSLRVPLLVPQPRSRSHSPLAALSLVGVYMTATLDPASRRSTVLVLFISGNAYAFAAGSLSLATNVLATALIAYKAWYVPPLSFKLLAKSDTKLQPSWVNSTGSTGAWSRNTSPRPGRARRCSARSPCSSSLAACTASSWCAPLSLLSSRFMQHPAHGAIREQRGQHRRF